MPTRVEVTAGLYYRVELPHSEVCMHMKVAGKRMLVKLLKERRAVQIFGDDLIPFSSTILPGEAGLLHSMDDSYNLSEGFYYVEYGTVEGPVAPNGWDSVGTDTPQ